MHNRFVHSNGSLNPPCTNLCPTIHHRQRNKFQIYRSALIVTNSNEIKKGSHQNGIKSAQILTQYSSYLQIYRSALIVTREPAKIGLKKEGRMGNNKGASKPLLPRSKGRPCRCRRGSAGRCTAPPYRGPIPARSDRHRCPSPARSDRHRCPWPAEERERVFCLGLLWRR